MSIQAIRAELAGNTALYVALTDQQVADELNAVDKTKARDSIPGSELFGYTNAAEYGNLTDAQKQQWLGLCGIDSVSKAAVPLIQSLFNGASTTWGNIIKTETRSRAGELGIPRVEVGHVTRARA